MAKGGRRLRRAIGMVRERECWQEDGIGRMAGVGDNV